MQLSVVNAGGAGAGTSLDVNEQVFSAPFNEPLVHQVVTAYMAGARAGTRAHKTRAQVSGGNSKPWRQKGTGRARAGSSRSPLWRGGGKTFAATPADHSQKVNRKMYRGAMRAILSELVRQERLVVVDQLSVSAPRTRELAARLRDMGLDDVLVITEASDEALMLAGRNLHWVGIQESADVSPVSLLAFSKVLCTVPALKHIEERVA